MVLPEIACEPQNQTADECPPAKSGEESRSHHNSERRRRWEVKSLAVAIVTAGVLLAIYLLRLDGVVGEFKDDGWYVVLARSLASGQGYNMINLPQHSGLYFYPPFFPLLLSLLYRLSPEFPGNVFLLKSLSVASMFVLGVLVFQFFNRPDRLPRLLAYLAAFATVAAPSFVFLATSSVMSECLFASLSFATLLSVERCSHEVQNYPYLGKVMIVAVLASACYLTRTIGIALVAAVVVHFLARRMFKSVGVFVIAVAVCIAPWTLYKHFRALESSSSTMIAENYSSQFWDRLASSGTKVTPRALPGRVWQISTVIIGDDIGGLILPALYRFGSESGEELTAMTAVIPGVSRNAIGLDGATMGLGVAGQIISACLSILVLIGCFRCVRRGVSCAELAFGFSLIMIIFWPWNPIRFLVPLLPFLLYYLILGIAVVQEAITKAVGRLATSTPWNAARIALLCILAFFIYDNAMYLVSTHKNPNSFQYPDWLRQDYASRQAAEWVREHTSEKQVVGSDNPSMVYLYSGRMTDMCRVSECAKKGIGYYVNSLWTPLPSASNVVFRTNYYAVNVAEIRDASR
jgi:hypothetical protein